MQEKIFADRTSAVKGLGSQDKATERLALFYLDMMGKDRAEALISLLKDEDSEIRRVAAETLGKIRALSAVEPLITILKDEDPIARSKAAWALGEIGDGRAVEPLIGALKDNNVQSQATPNIHAKVLAVDRDTNVARVSVGQVDGVKKGQMFFICRGDVLIGKVMVEEVNENTCSSTVLPYKIGNLKVEEGDDANPQLNETVSAYVQREATGALVKIGIPTVPPLIAALKGDDAYVREEATRVLCKIKTPYAVEPLLFALKDKDLVVRELAARVLRVTTGQHFGEDYAKWQEWWSNNKNLFR